MAAARVVVPTEAVARLEAAKVAGEGLMGAVRRAVATVAAAKGKVEERREAALEAVVLRAVVLELEVGELVVYPEVD